MAWWRLFGRLWECRRLARLALLREEIQAVLRPRVSESEIEAAADRLLSLAA